MARQPNTTMKGRNIEYKVVLSSPSRYDITQLAMAIGTRGTKTFFTEMIVAPKVGPSVESATTFPIHPTGRTSCSVKMRRASVANVVADARPAAAKRSLASSVGRQGSRYRRGSFWFWAALWRMENGLSR